MRHEAAADLVHADRAAHRVGTGRRDGRSVVYELHDAHVTALLRQVPAHVHHGGRA
ncbi:hypothetical protein ACFWBN_30735 [Streptomyces sp. NPDC059989]|uniref:hypothetical protein n=1 Tax=Streptomyces sp. NPDC059989 TaxID=3347026 RepID=UPI0036C4C36E